MFRERDQDRDTERVRKKVRERERERADPTPRNSDNVVMKATLQQYQMNSDRVIMDSKEHQANILPTRVWSVALGK